jgi:hypothetical protein
MRVLAVYPAPVSLEQLKHFGGIPVIQVLPVWLVGFFPGEHLPQSAEDGGVIHVGVPVVYFCIDIDAQERVYVYEDSISLG